MLLNHIAIICSSINSVEFYKKIGFCVKSIEDRGYDQLIFMSDGITTLELFIDPSHPKRITAPEALGLRHIAFSTDEIDDFADKWQVEIKEDKRGKFCFIYDPDGLPIEIRENVSKAS